MLVNRREGGLTSVVASLPVLDVVTFDFTLSLLVLLVHVVLKFHQNAEIAFC